MRSAGCATCSRTISSSERPRAWCRRRAPSSSARRCAALSEMQLAFEPDIFVPAEARRRFAVAVNNYAAVVLAPKLGARVGATAPSVRLDLQPSGTLDIAGRLDRGELGSQRSVSGNERVSV